MKKNFQILNPNNNFRIIVYQDINFLSLVANIITRAIYCQ